MKKAIIIVISIVLLAALAFFGLKYVNEYIETSGPVDDVPPMIMINEMLCETLSSSDATAFEFIKQSQGFVLSPDKISEAIPFDQTPTKNLTSNFDILVGNDLYISPKQPNEVYIKTVVNTEVRYYRFTKIEKEN